MSYDDRRYGHRGGRGRGRGRGGGWRGRGERPARQFQAPEEANDPEFQQNWDQKCESFDDMGLNEDLLQGVYGYGFREPSEIQQLSVKPIGEGRNIIGMAQSGTGKTGAFCVGILQRVDCSRRETQALVLSPTRELCDQTFLVFQQIGSKMTEKQGLIVECIRGGMNVEETRTKVANQPHVVVGTPGRVLDVVNSGDLKMASLNILCLDEADELLSEGFVEDMKALFAYIQPGCQSLCFSATLPPTAFQIMKSFIVDPLKIIVRPEKLTLQGIQQFKIDVKDDRYKFDTLYDILGKIPVTTTIVFVNKKETADQVVQQFGEKHFPASVFHAGLRPEQRDLTMKEFRTGKTRVLVSTDVLGRGIDVQQVTLVVNYDLPLNVEQYLHRIGRGGRYGRKGVSINLMNTKENLAMEEIQRYYHTDVPALPQEFDQIIGKVLESRPEEDK